MKLDHLVGRNVMVQFDRALYVVGFVPEQGSFLPVRTGGDGVPVMSDVLQGKLSKSQTGIFMITYANPLDGGKTRVTTTIDETMVIQACSIPEPVAPESPAQPSEAS